MLDPCNDVLCVGAVYVSQVSNATTSNSLIGFASAVMVCVCSGLAGVFFELMIKVKGAGL